MNPTFSSLTRRSFIGAGAASITVAPFVQANVVAAETSGTTRVVEPPVGKRIFIQTVQQINGWRDRPKTTSARVVAP